MGDVREAEGFARCVRRFRRGGAAAAVAGVLLAAGCLTAPTAQGASLGRAAAQEQADPTAFLAAFRQAHQSGEVAQVLRLFAADAVIAFEDGDPDRLREYRGRGEGATSLHAGVVALLESGAHLDLANHRTAPAAVGGLPGTAVSWPYRMASRVPAVPPEVGVDEVILLGGQIVAYTRRPDATNEVARALARSRHVTALATRTAEATEVAAAGGPPRPGERRNRNTARGVRPWIVAAGLAVVGAALLALGRRPTER